MGIAANLAPASIKAVHATDGSCVFPDHSVAQLLDLEGGFRSGGRQG
jgi:hypothetical protein